MEFGLNGRSHSVGRVPKDKSTLENPQRASFRHCLPLQAATWTSSEGLQRGCLKRHINQAPRNENPPRTCRGRSLAGTRPRLGRGSGRRPSPKQPVLKSPRPAAPSTPHPAHAPAYPQARGGGVDRQHEAGTREELNALPSVAWRLLEGGFQARRGRFRTRTGGRPIAQTGRPLHPELQDGGVPTPASEHVASLPDPLRLAGQLPPAGEPSPRTIAPCRSTRQRRPGGGPLGTGFLETCIQSLWTSPAFQKLSLGFSAGSVVWSLVRLLATPWAVARRAPLSMGHSKARMLEWVAISLLQGIFLTQGSKPRLRHCRRVLIISTTWQAHTPLYRE